MCMTNERNYDQWIGMDAVDRDGDKLGKVESIFHDDVSGRPEWVQIKAGIFKGMRIAPLAGAEFDDVDNRLILGCTKDQINGAPDFAANEGHLDAGEEQKLYSHYGFDWNGRGTEHHGYGKQWNPNRFDAQYPRRDVGRIGNIGTDKDARTETTQVHTTAQVEVPVDAQVRLRRYETENQRTETRTVEVPVTETEEHVEVVGVDAKAQRPQQQQTKR